MNLSTLREQYLAAQLAGDGTEAMRLVIEEGRAMGATIKQLQTAVIASAQLEIGRRWQLNQVTVAQEHAASAITQLVLSALYEKAIAQPPIAKKIVMACVEGEHHDLPPRMLSDALGLEGFDVRFLGANVRTEELVTIVAREVPDLIGLSVTMTFNLPALRSAVPKLRAITSAPILVGGHAVDWSGTLPAELGIAPAGGSLDEVIANIRAATGVR